ncbi:Adenylate cyclase (EC [Olavius algarvensis Delta 1 endosymbiont]|nr:Adenylate cyclase (EC [Olavius algarvensis Delta 1 endosymbiont]
MQSKTLTILIADIQGFTSRTSSQTREENEIFIKETHTFVIKHVEEFGGRLVKSMGDGFLITFESPTNAIKCGLSMQNEICRRNANILNSDHFIKFRIGVSTGEVNLNQEGDVFGDAVNIAARIESFAEPNQVFISESTYLSMNQTEVSALDLGPQQFKNVVREIRVYRVFDGQNEMADMSVNSEKKTGSAGYKYLLAGLGIGILVTAILLSAILIPAYKKDLRPPAEIAVTHYEPDEPETTDMPANPSGDFIQRNPPDHPLPNERFDAADRIQLIDKEELNRLQAELAFLEWAVRAEE